MKEQKQVEVLARYIHKNPETGKPNGTVSYLVRSSDGKSTYCTTIINGQASGCSCPASRGKCYHRTQLQAREQERKEVAQQFSAKTVPTWAMQLVNAGKLVAPKPKLVALPRVEKVDLSTKGNLNVSRPFSILKPAS